MGMLRVVTYFGITSSALARKGEAPSRRGGVFPGIPFPPTLPGAHLSKLSIFVDESGEWGKLSEYYLITLVLHVQSDSVAEHIDKYERHLADSGLPDIPFHVSDFQ